MYYQQDLANIHDTGFPQMARAAAQKIKDLLLKYKLPGAHIVDLGCGSGTMAKILVEHGCRVTGIDYSPEMIALAKQQVPEGDFIVGSFVDADIPSCQAVTAIGEIFCYCFDENNNQDTLRSVLKRIYDALQPGGFLLFDCVEAGILGESPRLARVLESADWSLMLDYTEDRVGNMLERNILIFKKEVGTDLYRRSKEVHRLKMYPLETMIQLVNETGFYEVHSLSRYADLTLRAHNYAILAIK